MTSNRSEPPSPGETAAYGRLWVTCALALSALQVGYAAAQAVLATSDPFYAGTGAQVVWNERLYFRNIVPDPAQGKLLEYDPSVAGLGGRGQFRVVERAPIFALLASPSGVYYQREDDPSALQQWTGFDRAPRRVPAEVGPPWIVEAQGRGLCIAGVVRSQGVPSNFARCLEPDALLGRAAVPAREATASGERVFFKRRNALWVTDGSAMGPRVVHDFGSQGLLGELAVLGTSLIFSAQEARRTSQLFVVEPSTGEPRPIAELAATGYVAHGAWLFFKASVSPHGSELWRTDGTRAGTQLVADVAPGPYDSGPKLLTSYEDWLYFVAEGRAGEELYRTRGTAADTELVTDLHPRGSSYPDALTVVGDALYFTASNGVARHLWVTDASAQAPRPLAQPFPLNPSQLIDVAGTLYFWRTDAEWGTSLWRLRGERAEFVGAVSVPPLTLDASSNEYGYTRFLPRATPATPDQPAWHPLAAVSGDTLYLAYETADAAQFAQHPWRYRTYFDTDRRAETGLAVGSGDARVGAEYLLEGADLYRYVQGAGQGTWQRIARAEFATSLAVIELRVDQRAASPDALIGGRLAFHVGQAPSDGR